MTMRINLCPLVNFRSSCCSGLASDPTDLICAGRFPEDQTMEVSDKSRNKLPHSKQSPNRKTGVIFGPGYFNQPTGCPISASALSLVWKQSSALRRVISASRQVPDAFLARQPWHGTPNAMFLGRWRVPNAENIRHSGYWRSTSAKQQNLGNCSAVPRWSPVVDRHCLIQKCMQSCTY